MRCRLILAAALWSGCGPATVPPEELRVTRIAPTPEAEIVEASQSTESRAAVAVGSVLVLMTPKQMLEYYRSDAEVLEQDRIVFAGAHAVGLDLEGASSEAPAVIRAHPTASSALRADWATLCVPETLVALNESTPDRISLSMTDDVPEGLAAGDCLRTLTATEIHIKLETATDASLEHLGGLSGLVGLDLGRTLVTDDGLANLSGLEDLRVLDLYHTAISDQGLAHVSHLEGLEKLVLWSTRITDAGLVHLAGLTRLRVLNLGAIDLTGEGLAHLEGLAELRVLDLWLTDVSDESLVHLAHLANLRVLGLGWCSISNTGLAHIKDLKNLRALDLGLADVTDEGLYYLSGLTELRVLDLRMTGITDNGLAYLCSLSNLQELVLVETEVTEFGTTAFAKVRPGVLVTL